MKTPIQTQKVRGQSMLEVLISLAIVLISITAIVSVAFQNQSSSTYTQLNSTALYLAQRSLEDVRSAAKNNFSALASSSSTEDIFLKEIVVENISDSKKRITSRITWKTDPLRPQKVEFVTILTNWKSVASDGGSGPGGTPTGNWASPRTLGTTDLGPGNEGTDIWIKDTTVFMTAAASSPAKDDFFSFDVSNPNAPIKLASINTGAGLRSLSIKGNYAYVANQGTSQLQIIDISNPSNPVLVKSMSMQNVSEEGRSVFATEGLVFIGSKQSSGNEVQIFNISNPLNPGFVSSIETSADINDVYVYDNRAYIASQKSTGAITVYNVSNPSFPQQLSIIDFADAGLSVFAKDPFTLFSGIGNDFNIYNMTNPQSPVLVSTIDVGNVINDIYVVDYLAFLATGDSNKEFQIVNVANYSNPYIYATLNFPQMGTGIAYRNNIVYMSVRSNDALRIITSL